MSRPERQTKRRTLSFEDLEAKTSLTHLLGFSGMGATDVPAVIREAGYADASPLVRNGLLLRYVANLENVDIERTLPDSHSAAAADEWLATNTPES